MRQDEHFAEAERLLIESGEVVGDNALVAWKVAKAQVHATLASVAHSSDGGSVGTHLEYFDGLTKLLGIEVTDFDIARLLPGRQIRTKGHVVNFFFGDGGEYTGIDVSVIE